MGMQPILLITVSVKKIKGAARQRYVVTLDVTRPLHNDSLHKGTSSLFFYNLDVSRKDWIPLIKNVHETETDET